MAQPAQGPERVLEFIARFQAHYGYPPTIRQITRGTAQRSTSTVQQQIRRLVAEGYLGRRASYRQLWPVLARPASRPHRPERER